MQVFKASLWDDIVAIKLLDISRDESKENRADRRRAERELAVLKALRHPNVVQANPIWW